MSDDIEDKNVFERRALELGKYKRGDEVIFPTGSEASPAFLDENFVVSEVNVNPLGDIIMNFLIRRDREDTLVDFKETLSIAKNSTFVKVAKDIFAFANRGGGYILLGFRERKSRAALPTNVDEEQPRFQPIGLPADFLIDQADLQAKFNAYSNAPIQIGYREFKKDIGGDLRRFALIYIPASTQVLKPIRDGTYRDDNGKLKQAFSKEAILIRRGTQCLPATEEEVNWIERRAEKEGYRLSILSGQPDEISEQLYSNMFSVLQMPSTVALLDRNVFDRTVNSEALSIPPTLVFRRWNDKLVTIGDISGLEARRHDTFAPSTPHDEELATWLSDEGRRRVIISVLNKELAFHARRLGMLQEPYSQKFYYSCDGEYRNETWVTSRGRSSTLKVAGVIWAQQLNRPIYWHLGAEANFIYLGKDMFLQINPTVQLTSDGRNAVFGAREGTVITRLVYNWYNPTYLNQMLFWIWRLAEGKETISLAQGRVVVAARPVQAGIGVGILHDRPTSEPLQATPEIKIEGEENGSNISH